MVHTTKEGCQKPKLTSKIAFNSGTSASIKQMFSSIEAFMPLAANRNKSLKINEFKEAYENVSRKNFDELTLSALLSVYPEAYNVKISGNILHVTSHRTSWG